MVHTARWPLGRIRKEIQIDIQAATIPDIRQEIQIVQIEIPTRFAVSMILAGAAAARGD